MSIALITGSSGLIGSEAASFFHQKGFEIVGIDNNMRAYFFGDEASVEWKTEQLKNSLKHFRPHSVDIRDSAGIGKVFSTYQKDIEVIIHTAAQPSHDWAAREPITDFTINANGTLILLEAMRTHCPSSTFLFTSTNKVYGDAPNELPLVELDLRWEVEKSHPCAEHGIDEKFRVDRSKHSLFGASKLAADILVQEYGRYFSLNTGVFRGGCLTGPSHSGAELHGFLSYLVKCVLTGRDYIIYGYKGKQVRDNIHSYDLVNAFWQFAQSPRSGEVYNMGGSRYSNCSVLEVVEMLEKMTNKRLRYKLVEANRSGDHIWWISDVRKFQSHYPNWKYRYDLPRILEDIVAGSPKQWLKAA